MSLEEFCLYNNDLRQNRQRVLDKKNIGRGNQFSTIITEEMNNLIKFKAEENKQVAIKFGESVLQNDIRQVNLNLSQIQTHERNFIKSSIDKSQFTNIANNRPFKRKDMKIKPNLRTDKVYFKEKFKTTSSSNSKFHNLNSEYLKTEDDVEFDDEASCFDRDSNTVLMNIDVNDDDYKIKDLPTNNFRQRFSRDMKNIEEDISFEENLIEYQKQPMKSILAKNKLNSNSRKSTSFNDQNITNMNYEDVKDRNQNKTSISQDIRLKYTAQYPYQKVLNEEVINKSLKLLEEEKLAIKKAKICRSSIIKGTVKSSITKLKKIEPFCKKIIQQDSACDYILDDLDEKNHFVGSISKKLNKLRNSVADEFQFMNYISNRQEESLMNLSNQLQLTKANKKETKTKNRILQEVVMNNDE